MKIELERALEDRCTARVEALSGMALKLSIPGVRGFPDRTCLIGGRVFFVELKRLKTGRVSAQQSRWKAVLERLGFGVYLIDNDADFEAVLKKELYAR
jgi:hypothetical protein